MQRLITAQSISALEAVVNPMLEKGWRVAPGSVGMASCKVVGRHQARELTNAEGETYRISAWAVLYKKDEPCDAEPALRTSAENAAPHSSPN